MDRRRFLGLLGLGVAGIALDEAIPLNRVWSFPARIVIPEPRVQVADVADWMILLEPDSTPLYVLTNRRRRRR
jgi:hypothetical protein